jgi:predicted amidohydrolase YtcJ
MPEHYTDHHVHTLASAAARLSVDVSTARSLAEMAAAIRAAASGPTAGWMRAWGYEEWALADRRHPTRQDLDAASRARPLVVHHRSGHVAVLNSVALAEVGEDGHPDGVLFDRHDLLSRVPRLDSGALASAAARVSAEWEGDGVTAVVDATHTNGPEEIETLAGWWDKGVLRQRVTAMVSAGHAHAVAPYGASVDGVRIGAVKLMPSPASFDGAALAASVAAAHAAGFPVAVHVVEVDGLDAALAAFEASPPPPGTVDRIEHNALCLPEQVGRIAACRAMVVVNPSFLLHRRPKYERELAPVERGWLIRMRSLVDAGIEVRAGSDAPVVPSRPAEIIAAAMAHPFAPGESLGAEAAEALLGP